MPDSQVVPAQQDPTPLPSIYEWTAKARAMGYPQDQIDTYLGQYRGQAKAAGYSNEDINHALGLEPTAGLPIHPDDMKVPPLQNASGAGARFMFDLREGFGDEPLGPSPLVTDVLTARTGPNVLAAFNSGVTVPVLKILDAVLRGGAAIGHALAPYTGGMTEDPMLGGAIHAPLPIRSAGDFARQAGASAADIGKLYGHDVVNGMSAATEMLDGRPRTAADMQALAEEAKAYTEIPSVKSAADSTRSMPAGLPTINDVIDAAASLSDTRGSGIQYHGTQTPIDTFHDEVYNPLNYYGQGFYTTDALDVAKGYARKNGTVYQAAEKHLVKLFDMEGPISPELMAKLGKHEFDDATNEAFGENPSSLRDLFDSARGLARANDIPANEVQESWYTIRGILEDEGYRGLKMQGGKLTKTPPHSVSIYWHPAEDIAISPLREDHTTVMRNLGQHFIKTGEHPLDAAVRAQSNPDLKTQLTSDLARRLVEQKADEIDEATRGPSFQRLAGKMSGYNPETGETVPITPETILNRNEIMSRGLLDNLRQIYDPASRGAEAEKTGAILRETGAAEDLANRQAAYGLHQFGRAAKDLTPQQAASFVHAFETGDASLFGSDSVIGQMANDLHDRLDKSWGELDKRGVAPEYVEYFLPHAYADPVEAERAIANRYGTKTSGAATPFLRKRLFSTYFEAAQELGLTPKFNDPVELVLTHLQAVNRFIRKTDMVQQLKDAGVLHWRPSEISREEAMRFAGMKPVDPSVAGAPGGQWVAPEPVATVLNRAFSAGLSGRPIYDVLRSATNMTTQAVLTLSAFHPTYLSIASIASRMAKGLKQISRSTPEEMLRGAGSILSSPIAPIHDAVVGYKLRKMLLNDDVPENQRTLADAFVAGGNRLGGDRLYRASAYGSFWEAIHGSALNAAQAFENGSWKEGGLWQAQPGKGPMTMTQAIRTMFEEAAPIKVLGKEILPGQVRATAMLVPRIFDTLMAPIMGHLVPWMKTGAFADLMKDEIRANPEMSHDAMRVTAQRINRSIDNRMGLLTRDNRFWNKSLNDAGQITFLAENWVIGHLDEMGSGLKDALKGRSIKAGEMNQLSDHTVQIIGIVATTAMLGAVYGMLHGTWKSDWSAKDYFFPPTGGKDAQGGDERVSFPSMVKDMYEWGAEPFNKVNFSMSPAIHMAISMLQDRDFTGAALYDPNDSFPVEAGEYAHSLIKQVTPLAFRQPSNPDSGISNFETKLGFRPAPYAIREPEREQSFEQRDTAKAAATFHREEEQP